MSALKIPGIRWLLVTTFIVGILFGTAGSVSATEFVDGETIPADAIIDDDVFISGELVTIDGTIKGNLYVVGQNITINGKVDGNLFSVGQNVTINGQIGGSAHASGASITLAPNANINRNLYTSGFSLRTEPGSTIGRDLVGGSYQFLLSGHVARDILIACGALELDGNVGRHLDITTGSPTDAGINSFMPNNMPQQVAPGLRIAESAQIGGQVAYSSSVDQSNNIKATPVEGISFNQTVTEEESQQPSTANGIGSSFFTGLQEILSLLLLGALVLWKWPTPFRHIVNKAQANPLPSAGWGLLTILGGYLAIVIITLLILLAAAFLAIATFGGLAGTVMGVGFGSLFAGSAIFQLLISYGSKLVVAFLIGQLILQRIAPQQAKPKRWNLIVGVLIYLLLSGLPFIGWLIARIATLIGIGAMWLLYRDGDLVDVVDKGEVAVVNVMDKREVAVGV
ncbi:MAG: polymer-forming cytoskeletal protein [Ardenticatenaceae bacterium]